MATKQPASLVDLSTQAVGSLIANQACLVVEGNVSIVNMELEIAESAQYYNTTIPPLMHNHVTYHTIKYLKERKVLIPQEKDLVFSIVLRSHVTKFDLSDWPEEMHCMLCRNLSNLKHLKLLNGVNLENGNLSYVLEGIKDMTQLENFQSDNGSDEAVQVLCDNCPALVILSLGGNNITDSSVRHLLKLHNLQQLDVMATAISELGLRQLLQGLPQLKDFKALKHFLPVPVTLTSLESLYASCQSQEDVENITHFCPSVTKLIIIGANKSLDLSNVANLEYLTTLSVSATGFYKCNVNIILQKIGHQITVLSLSGTQDILLEMLLNEINTSCPNLKCLHINSYSFEMDNKFFNSTDNQHVFPNLETVNIQDYYGGTSCFIYLLSACVNIRAVSFGPLKELCDQDIDRILLCNPLIHLQELYIREHKLTVSSIYKLLSSCKELRFIGFVDIWKWAHGTITDSKIEEVCNYIQKNNLNVEVIYNYEDAEEKKRVSVMKP